jgi:hypothetical protein
MKNYNIFALRGDTETNDIEVCESLGLPMELAGTAGINRAAIEKMYQENIKGALARGIPEKEAYAMAGQKASAATKEVSRLLKEK